MILITGGAGYIGSHVNKLFNQNGYETLVLDNLSKGHKESVKWGEFVKCDLGDEEALMEIFDSYDIEGVMHFAAFSSVSESVENPEKYFKNNFENTLTLLRVMKEHRVFKIIFSSTAAVYGTPEELPITEHTILKPINPYGESKLMVENVLSDEAEFTPLKYVSLRYFNAAGADFDCEIGENHNPESHLIPLVLDTAMGRRKSISIFGDDYDTPDGTCVRDYIHVCDLAEAHLKAYQYLEQDGAVSNIFNLGNGAGYSVKEVIDVCKEVTDVDFDVKVEGRREGDPDILIADAGKAREILNWIPKYDLKKIISSAWDWHQKLHG